MHRSDNEFCVHATIVLNLDQDSLISLGQLLIPVLVLKYFWKHYKWHHAYTMIDTTWSHKQHDVPTNVCIPILMNPFCGVVQAMARDAIKKIYKFNYFPSPSKQIASNASSFGVDVFCNTMTLSGLRIFQLPVKTTWVEKLNSQNLWNLYLLQQFF